MHSNKGVHMKDDLSVAYLDTGVMVNLGATTIPKTDKATPVESTILKNNIYAPCGTDNGYFNKIRKYIRSNSDLSSGLSDITMSIVSDGVVYGKYDISSGTRKFNIMNGTVPEIDSFLANSNIDDYFSESIYNFLCFWLSIPDIIRSTDLNEIIHIRNINTADTRLGWQNDYGMIDKIFVHPDFKDNVTIDNDKLLQLPVADTFGNTAENIHAMKERRIAMYLQGFGHETYYRPAPWHSLIEGKILDFSKLIWEYKEKMMRNQMTIKYLLEIADWWWEKKYGADFWEWSIDKRKTTMEDELSDFNEKMKGVDKAGNSVLSITYTDFDNKTTYSGWKITAIDKGSLQNLFLEDSREVTSFIMRAIQMDSSLVGSPMGKGGGQGAGSGSDKKAADGRQTRKFQYMINKSLSPLYVARDYNKWDKDIVFGADTQLLVDQSEITPSKRQDPNPQAA